MNEMNAHRVAGARRGSDHHVQLGPAGHAGTAPGRALAQVDLRRGARDVVGARERATAEGGGVARAAFQWRAGLRAPLQPVLRAGGSLELLR